MADTTYIVLRRVGITGGGEWACEDETYEAPNAEAAIRKACSAIAGTPAGVYVAVPARSWKPVQVEAVQTTVLKLT